MKQRKTDTTQKENYLKYGIKVNKCPLQVKDLIGFEEDAIHSVHKVKFLRN